MSTRSSIGGSAAAGGTNYQSRAAAWLAIRILLEENATPLWGLPSSCQLDFIRCESGAHTDDILVGTSQSGFIFFQAKRQLSLSESEDSDFASALDQFTRQYLSTPASSGSTAPWNRAFDRNRDRLVLLTTSESSGPIRSDLETICRRAAQLAAGQSLGEAAQTVGETAALTKAKAHIVRSWTAVRGAAPSDDDIRDLLGSIYVQTLDVEPNGGHETTAKDSLRGHILVTPSQTELAWRSLISLFTDLSASRSGLNRQQIQQHLVAEGINVRPARSFQEDIQKLRNYSRRVLAALSVHSKITVRGADLRITRSALSELSHAAESTSLLVIGDPGAGKSGIMHNFAEALVAAGRDFVLLSADRLGACTTGEIRSELGLNSDLIDVLENWPGRESGFIIIDALDVARAETAAAALRQLIASITQNGGRWKVVASVRKFDLRYSLELQRLFPCRTSIASIDPTFSRVQHVNVPLLSETELSQASTALPALHDVYKTANAKLQQLLRVPFNLRLMADLLDAGAEASSLVPIQTQLDLLDRYWTARIIRTDGRRDARELLLRSVCQKMVEVAALKIPRENVATETNSEVLDDTLRANIISEWQANETAPVDQNSIAFSHHILFDYAVARLVFRSAPPLRDRLVAAPDLAIFARPSIVLHLQYLWSQQGNHGPFWEVSLALSADPQVSEIAKVICGVVAADLTADIADLEELMSAIASNQPRVREQSEKLLRHVFGALNAAFPTGQDLISSRGEVWCRAIARVSQHLRIETVYSVRAFLCFLLEAPASLNTTQRDLLGESARRLLDFAWPLSQPDPNLVTHSIQCVCKTYSSNVSESRRSLNRILDPTRLQERGFQELPALTDEIDTVIRDDPEFAVEIYRAAFSFSEDSKEEVPMGNSRIMPLMTNKRQNYEMAHYRLSEGFKTLLERDFIRATEALGHVLTGYIKERHRGSEERENLDFVLWDGSHRVRVDHSAIWDSGGVYSQDDGIKILDEWEARFEELVPDSANLAILKQSIITLLEHAPSAIVMGRLMAVGVKYPEAIGRLLSPSLASASVLTSYDLSDAALQLLAVMHPLLSGEERLPIEQAIMGIPEGVDTDRREAAEHVRDRFIGVLRQEHVALPDLRPLVSENPSPPSLRARGITGGFTEFTEEDELSERGVPVHDPANAEFRRLEGPVKQFNDKFLNATPSLEEINTIFPHLTALNTAVVSATTSGVHGEQKNYGETNLVRACSQIAKADDLDCATPAGQLVREVLLRGATDKRPELAQDSEERFHTNSGWGLYPRSEAAEGLTLLSRNKKCCNTDILREVERLLSDPHPLVRHHVAFYLRLLGNSNEPKMWELIEHVTNSETNRGVLAALISGSLYALAGRHRERIVSYMGTILSRCTGGPGSDRILKKCVTFFCNLFIWKNDLVSQRFVADVVSGIEARAEQAKLIVPLLREPIKTGPVSPPDIEQEGVRRRAIQLMSDLLRASIDRLDAIQSQRADTPFEEWPATERELARSLASVIDGVANQVYFASGAYDERRSSGNEQEDVLSIEQKQRFYEELQPVITLLAGAGFASVTHHLLETLEAFIEIDPKGVFLLIAKVVEGGKRGGYQFESLAVDLMVRLVERYLAEYRGLLQTQECREALMSVLNIFVEAGWPKARALTYQLDDIFR